MSYISMQIRKAISAALPAPENQHLTVMAPGKAVEFGNYVTFLAGAESKTDLDLADDYRLYDKRKEIGRKVEISQAILCDDMPAVDSVQLGPTGKSVSRSYLKAISKLVSDCELSIPIF